MQARLEEIAFLRVLFFYSFPSIAVEHASPYYNENEHIPLTY